MVLQLALAVGGLIVVLAIRDLAKKRLLLGLA
jgi:hypothetical protein